MEHEENIDSFNDWINRPCRECGHELYRHFLGANSKKDKIIVGACNHIQFGFCTCLEWMSPDNLDYIELLAKRKGLLPDDKDEK